MNFRQMEIFYAVMLRGSVTGAAQLLGRTQPAVTKILRHTEDTLKFPLFHRVKGRLVPTEEALTLFPDVERVFDELMAVQQSLEDVRMLRSGQLRIASIPTLGEVALPRAISLFKKEHPDTKITFEVRPRRAVVQSVATQRAELGFAFLANHHANVEARPLCRGSMVCLIPRSHKLAEREVVTVADLNGSSMVGYSRQQALRPIIEDSFRQGRSTFTTAIEVAWVSTAWAMVNNGAGVALVDDFSQLDRLYPDVEVRPFSPTIHLQADTLLPRGKPLSRLARQFLEVVSHVLSERSDG